MGLIAWIVFGALIGWLASLIAGTDERQGALGNILVGIAGAFIGGLLASLFGISGVSGFNFQSIVIALVGSVILLAVFKSIRGHSV
jgi:uncharacterized membrane protein YeaQ/YmgE (transglycosylase-associated protein family)